MAISKGLIGRRYGLHSGNGIFKNVEIIEDLTIYGNVIVKTDPKGRLGTKTGLAFVDEDGATLAEIKTTGNLKLRGEVERV